jgi:bifunctional non-homologous end joining protein LigD
MANRTFPAAEQDRKRKDTSDMSTVRAKSVNRTTSTRREKVPESLADSEIAGMKLTHPERMLFPDAGVTKLDLARYYAQISDWVLPHLVNRPLSLVRCPDGSAGQCFYQKHWKDTLPEAISYVTIREKSGSGRYVQIEDLAGLIGLVQISVLEIHPWGATADKLENPDRIVIDLDPGPGVAWAAVTQGARDVREVLDQLGLESFVRTSGGKGLHVVVPLSRRNTWDEVEAFAHYVALGLSTHAGVRYVANMRKALRNKRIYVDYLRNQRGSTAVGSYSTRTRPGCPIATPLDWKELARLPSADAFTIKTIPRRLAKLRKDPWEKFFAVRQSLTKALLDRAQWFAAPRTK